MKRACSASWLPTAHRNPYLCPMVDYLIIGLGLAGVAFCESLVAHGKSFTVLDEGQASASRVAGGIYNPVVLKRLNKAWMAEDQVPLVAPFYDQLEEKLNCRFHYPLRLLRRFASAAEHNAWVAASETPALKPFLNPDILNYSNPGLHAPFGFGEVRGAGRVDTETLLDAYGRYLGRTGNLIQTTFQPGELTIGKDFFRYGKLEAARIVFTTGFGNGRLPFFGHLPLQGNKGEYLEILCPQLQEEQLIKASIFLIPLSDHRYLAGATYDWKDHEVEPTPAAESYLRAKLDDLLRCPYEVVGRVAGIRPTVPDRRPLVGRHPKVPRMYLLNGLGSRGVMIAPYAAQKLYQTIEENSPLPAEMDCSRFKGTGSQEAEAVLGS